MIYNGKEESKEKSKEKEEVIGKLFGALPIDQLVNPSSNGEGFFFVVKYEYV